MQLSLPEDLEATCVSLLSLRRRLSSSTLRPFLHRHTRTLDLSNMDGRMSLDVVRCVSRAPLLQHLFLRSSLGPHPQSILDHLMCPHLLTLDCSSCPRLDGSHLQPLLKVSTMLRILRLSHCPHMTMLPASHALPSLTQLDTQCCHRLQRAFEDGVWPPQLIAWTSRQCPLLRHWPNEPYPTSLALLDVTMCTLLPLPHLMPPTLNTLNVSGSNHFHPSSLQHCSDLTTLDCSRCTNIDDVGIQDYLPKLPSLHSLSLDSCTTLIKLPICPSLTALSIAHCTSLQSLTPLAFMPSLTAVSLAHCSNLVNDAAIAHIARCLPSLSWFDVSWCPNVTDTSLNALSACTALKTLRLFGCTQLTPLAVKTLAMEKPTLKIYAALNEADWACYPQLV